MKKIFGTLLIGLLATACSSNPKVAEKGWSEAPTYREPAASCELNGEWKECKNARRNDWADQYLLDTRGNLFAYKKAGNLKCQVTNDVKDFKISQHPSDAASIYFERNNDLYILLFRGDGGGNGCPKQDKKVIMNNVNKFTVTSNTDTTIVNVAQDESGSLVAWDNANAVYRDSGVREYQMNSCYGEDRASFSSYVLFSIDSAGEITKVKGKGFVGSKGTGQRYHSIGDFKDRENVCK